MTRNEEELEQIILTDLEFKDLPLMDAISLY